MKCQQKLCPDLMVSPVLLYSHRDTHPHYGHLAVVDSPMVQKFLQCYIQRRQNQGLLGNAFAWHGKWLNKMRPSKRFLCFVIHKLNQ